MKKATTVPPEGDKRSCSIALVGEQPGRSEIYTRKPFTGPAGKELTSCLTTAKISRFECYITNVVKDLDLPLDQYIKFGRGTAVLSRDSKSTCKSIKSYVAYSSYYINTTI